VSSIHADIQAHMEVLEQQQLPDAGGGAGKVLAMDVGLNISSFSRNSTKLTKKM